MQNNREIGTKYETAVCQYLENKGYKIVEKNFRCKQGEIDIIAYDGSCLVFVEVKYRRNTKTGHPMEAVSYYKQRTISKVAIYYMYSHGISDTVPVRFDVASVLGDHIDYIENAFNYVG